MLKGIDISSWQADLNLTGTNIDFVIVKATEGTSYVSPSCDKHVQQAKGKGMLFGFYHFASGHDAKQEARFFRRATTGYEKLGIPVLDFEITVSNPALWCETFMQEYYNLTKTWPMLYISASRCPNFARSWIPSKCGLWLAGYPQQYTYFPNVNLPYDISPWKTCAIWQFTDCLRLSGYAANVDGDLAYMDRSAWSRYANPGNAPASKPSSDKKPKIDYHELAFQIWKGKWGNGADRRKRLEDAGYDYKTAQELMNRYITTARECIQGKWGNGWNRKTALESHGYRYDLVQRIVNDMMGVK